MASQLLPFVPAIGSYRFGTVLGGTQYIFDVRWNARDAAWYFDLLDEQESIITCGVKIVLGTFLGRRTIDPRFPLGILVATDWSGAGRDATYDDLGTRVGVYYYALANLQAL